MILGYEMFRNLVNTNKVKKKIKQTYLDTLLDPGRLICSIFCTFYPQSFLNFQRKFLTFKKKSIIC